MKRLIVILATLAMLLAFVPVVSAATQNPGACDGAANRAILWENKSNDTSDGNDNWWACNGGAHMEKFSDQSHTIPTNCKVNGNPVGHGNWNDCVSSITAYVQTGYRLCLYHDHFYSVLLAQVTGPISNVRYDLASNDAASSFRVRTVAQGC